MGFCLLVCLFVCCQKDSDVRIRTAGGNVRSLKGQLVESLWVVRFQQNSPLNKHTKTLSQNFQAVGKVDASFYLFSVFSSGYYIFNLATLLVGKRPNSLTLYKSELH